MTGDDELARLRRHMDDINRRLVEVLHERARLCRRIRDAKRAAGQQGVDPVRERAMGAAVVALADDEGFPAAALARIFEVVLTESRRLMG